MMAMTLVIATYLILNVLVTAVIQGFAANSRAVTLKERRDISAAISAMMLVIVATAAIVLTEVVPASGETIGWLIVLALGIPTAFQLVFLYRTVRGQW